MSTVPGPRLPLVLPVALALALLAPALVAYLSLNPPAPEGALVASSVSVPGLDVAVAGSPTPTSVAVSSPLDVQRGQGVATRATDTLLKISAAGGALLPRADVEVLMADGSLERVTLDGALAVTTGANGLVTIKVLSAAGAPLVATVKPTAPATLDVTFERAGGEKVRVAHAVPGVATESDPATGAPRAAVVRNPLRTATGLPDGALPGGAFAPDLASLGRDGAGVTLAFLGERVPLGPATLEGSPTEPSGLVASSAGERLATLRVEPPTPERATLRVTLEGPAVALLEPGATRLTLDTAATGQPFSLGALALASEAGDVAARLVELGGGKTLLELANAGDASALSLPALGKTDALPEPLAFDLASGASGATTLVARDLSGREAARLVATPGEPARFALTFGPGWPSAGDARIDGFVSALHGLATFVVGGTASPVATALALPGEMPFLVARAGPGGAVSVAYPGVSEQVPGGAIRFEGDPAGLSPWTLVVEQGGDTLLAAKVTRDALLAGSRLARPTITVENALAPAPLVLAPPFALEGDLAARRLDSARVFAPTEGAPVVAAIERTSSGWMVTSPAGAHDVAGGHLTFLGDPVAGDAATLSLSAGPAIMASRATGALTVTGVPGGPIHVVGPVAYAGLPDNPSLVAVQAPDGSGELLRYERGADGSGSLWVAGEKKAAATRALRFEGRATDPGFAFALQKPDGSSERVEVDALAALLPASGERQAVVSLLASDSAPRGLVDVRDATGHPFTAAELDGGPWLALTGPHVARLAIAAGEDDWTRISLLAGDAARATFARRADGATRVYEASYAPPGAHGAALALAVRYERETSPFVVEAFDERGYAYRLDGIGPTVTVVAPEAADAGTFAVSWSGTDAGSGLARFAVERRIGSGPWETWIEATAAPEALFSGEAGKSYAFRARGIDAAGNRGAWSAWRTTEVLAGASGGTNAPPSVLLLAPTGGETLSGVVTVAWEASDPDSTVPIVNLYASKDGGRAWKALYSGDAGGFEWDTTREPDGEAWKLRVIATDGSLQSADASGKLAIANAATLLVPPAPPEGWASARAGAGAGGASGAGGAGGAGGASEGAEGAAAAAGEAAATLAEMLEANRALVIGSAFGVVLIALVLWRNTRSRY